MINGIAAEIIKNNPELKQEVHLLLSKSFIPNAASVGEGTIFCQAGLIYKLRNEAELAFALGHELAHYYLDHSNSAIKQYVNTVYSKENQHKLKEISRAKYEQGKMLDEMAKKLTFSTLRHGREHEKEADSLAFIFLKNTRYDAETAIQCLSSLDSIDNSHFDTEKKLPQYFQFAEFPFQRGWLQKEEGLFGSEKSDFQKKTAEDDSLKTHPDCLLRLAAVAQLAKAQQVATKKTAGNAATFKQLQHQLQYEAIAYCWAKQNLGHCLFLSLEMLDEQPNDPYLITSIAKCFLQFYKSQKAHELSKVTDLPSYQNEKNYNRLLEFIQNLGRRDYVGVGYYFLKQHQNSCASYKHFEEALTQLTEAYSVEFKK